MPGVTANPTPATPRALRRTSLDSVGGTAWTLTALDPVPAGWAAVGEGPVAATVPGEMIVTGNGVKVLGFTNWPGRIPAAASALYARNLLTFLSTFWDKDAKAPMLPAEDEIVQGVTLTRGGAVVHKNFAPAAAA